MRSVWITDLRSREMRDACEYLSAQGWQVLTTPEGLCLWDEEAVQGFVNSCSDGLSNFATDDEILQTYLLHPDPEECCRDLLSQTYARGAGDNVTIAVVVKP